jgi:hypothetical protein
MVTACVCVAHTVAKSLFSRCSSRENHEATDVAKPIYVEIEVDGFKTEWREHKYCITLPYLTSFSGYPELWVARFTKLDLNEGLQDLFAWSFFDRHREALPCQEAFSFCSDHGVPWLDLDPV